MLFEVRSLNCCKRKVLIVFGTRPEAIKMCPLVHVLSESGFYDVKVCATGQHKEMLSSVLSIYGVKPDYQLGIMKPKQTLFDVTEEVMKNIEPILKSEMPDLVLVHGDTTTSFAAALSCFYLHIPVGHVEAGLRSRNMQAPFPEEFNRSCVSLVSSLHFAPTEESAANLINEGHDPSTVFVTGNTVIDAMKVTIKHSFRHPLLTWAGRKKLLLLTMHRRENVGEPMKRAFMAIRQVIDDNPDTVLIYPVHPNPAVRDIASRTLSGHERIKLIEPLDTLQFHNFLKNCFLVLTDSGGLQEEAPALDKPVLVLRDTTERPEGVKTGALRLVGTDPNSIIGAINDLLHDPEKYQRMAKAKNPYGDGFACQRILSAINQFFSNNEAGV